MDIGPLISRSTLHGGPGIWLGLLAIALASLAAGGAHLRLIHPFLGFRIFLASLVLGGLLAFGWGVVSFFRQGAPAGIAAVVLGALILASLLLSGGPALRLPRIHDVTTNPEDPPTFTHALEQADNARRDLSYPHGGQQVPTLQKKAYPDLGPIRSPLDVHQALERAREVATGLGWRVTWTDLKPEEAWMEAEAESSLFRFVDDVVVRIRPDSSGSGGSVVDLRSTSRFGHSDLGANAERIRRFRQRF